MSGIPFFYPLGDERINYAFKVWFYTLISCRKVNGYAPEYVDKLKILSLGSDAGTGQKQVTSVELLGEKNKIEWKQEADGLSLVYPDSAHLKTAVGFRIVCK